MRWYHDGVVLMMARGKERSDKLGKRAGREGRALSQRRQQLGGGKLRLKPDEWKGRCISLGGATFFALALAASIHARQEQYWRKI